MNWEERLRERYPQPEVHQVEAFYFSLDGGGREIIIEELIKRDIRVMLEIGCFLSGSARQWLEAKQDLKLIGVDPWDADFAAILERYSNNPVFEPCFAQILDRSAFIESVRRHGPYISALANMKQYKDRFIPVRARSPEVLYELKRLNVQPELIYFDSNKLLDDLTISHELFPEAVLCGDDWTWGKSEGYPVQRAVRLFCSQYGYQVRSKRASWVIDRMD